MATALRSRDHLSKAHRSLSISTLRNRRAEAAPAPVRRRKASTDVAPRPLPHLVLPPLFADEAAEVRQRLGPRVAYARLAKKREIVPPAHVAPASTWNPDLQTLTRLLAGGEWTAAVMMGGRILETTLLAAWERRLASLPDVLEQIDHLRARRSWKAAGFVEALYIGHRGGRVATVKSDFALAIVASKDVGILTREEAEQLHHARRIRNGTAHGWEVVTESMAGEVADAVVVAMVAAARPRPALPA